MEKAKKYENITWRNREDFAEKKCISKHTCNQNHFNVTKNNWRVPNKNVEKSGKSFNKQNFQNWRIPNKKAKKNSEIANKLNLRSETGKLKNVDKTTALNSNKPTSEVLQEELEVLNEESLNTTNPLKAIFGYIPKDEAQICKFSVNGECFKKSKCHLNHEEKILEGWTKDKANVVISNCNESTHPAFGTNFQVIPTYIEESGYKFYGQVISPDLIKFYELMNKINLPDELEKFHTYSENLIPTLAELVIAKYLDGLFYRAQIMDYDEITNSVVVFFVDYGNMETVPITDIRKWHSHLEVVSFQALHFTLDGIKCATIKESELKVFIEKSILNKIFHATVVNHFDSIYIKLFNDDDCNIINELSKLNICEVNEEAVHFNKPIKIPG